MDGYHLTRAQLDAMPDPATAHARRGAEFTFDGERFYGLVRRLRAPLTGTTGTVWAPSFDHAIKDPKEDDVAVERTHRIVVLEGNCKSMFLFPLSHLSLIFLPGAPTPLSFYLSFIIIIISRIFFPLSMGR
jgi:hypothetical protein